MTNDDLAALLAAATPGPWSWETESGEWPDLGTLIGGDGESVLWWDFDLGMSFNAPEDARLIARAPDMAAALIEAEKALAKIVDAAFYDNGDVTYDCNAMSMAYFAARAALAAIREGRE